MHAYDFTIVVPHSKGSLANLAEELGRERINIEGLCAVEQNGSVIFHLLTTDKTATTRAIAKVGYKVTEETEVIVERLEDRPGNTRQGHASPRRSRYQSDNRVPCD